ncbi:putative HAD-like superfamily protein [Helianthus annuus]|uniref:HAD-like superfamily protein n=1 Tax=Helianthus annuus TaxID=4232 RepID=A0A9K3NCP9_HELAN|nr:putative HAD-like superfamily protein [Helianthus annuus]
MVELGQTDTEVYAPKKTLQVWRTLLNWLAFFFQIFVQIIRATPSLINYSYSSSSPEFEPLPVVELSESAQAPPPYAASAVHIPPAGADVEYDVSQKLTVVLDLDETLVCAYETSSLPAIVRNQAIDAGLKWFELECVSSDKEFEGKAKVNYVNGILNVLDWMNSLPNSVNLLILCYLPLALKKTLVDSVCLSLLRHCRYAKPLVDRIDAENRFGRRLYRPSTSST